MRSSNLVRSALGLPGVEQPVDRSAVCPPGINKDVMSGFARASASLTWGLNAGLVSPRTLAVRSRKVLPLSSAQNPSSRLNVFPTAPTRPTVPEGRKDAKSQINECYPGLASTEPEVLRALMVRCADGDQQTFSDLYRRTAPRLLGVALRIVRRREWAEDALQESFMSIWKHIGQYATEKSAPLTWMTSIVRNRAIDLVRRPRHEETREDFENLAADLVDGKSSVEHACSVRSEESKLERCMEDLSPLQRQIIVMAYIHGMTHSELASRLGLPMGTIKSSLRRGLRKLSLAMGCSPSEHAQPTDGD